MIMTFQHSITSKKHFLLHPLMNPALAFITFLMGSSYKYF